MQLEKYDFKVGIETHEYEFYSKGPNGIIKKIVLFTRYPESRKKIYNLAFGDRDDNTGQINDLVVSNNQDQTKILATVASTILHFFQDKPDATVLAYGSTPSRTRLYQMNISKYWHEITPIFEVLGVFEETWESFTKGRNYDAFLVSRK